MLSVTGMPSPGKTRLLNALAAAGVEIDARSASDSRVKVHAETDLEALVEGGPLRRTREDASDADIVVRVDWEPTTESVRRVIALLASRGLDAQREVA